MTYKDRIIRTPEFFKTQAPRDPAKLFAATGLPGEPSTSFLDSLRDLEASEAEMKDGDDNAL